MRARTSQPSRAVDRGCAVEPPPRSSPVLHVEDGEEGAEGEGGDDHGENHGDHPYGRRLADVEALEGDEIEEEGKVRRRLSGSALGSHEDDVETLNDEEQA